MRDLDQTFDAGDAVDAGKSADVGSAVWRACGVACAKGNAGMMVAVESLLGRVGFPPARQALTVWLLLRSRQDPVAAVIIAGAKLDRWQHGERREEETKTNRGTTSHGEFNARHDGGIL